METDSVKKERESNMYINELQARVWERAEKVKREGQGKRKEKVKEGRRGK